MSQCGWLAEGLSSSPTGLLESFMIGSWLPPEPVARDSDRFVCANLAAPGLSGSLWDLRSLLGHVGSRSLIRDQTRAAYVGNAES